VPGIERATVKGLDALHIAHVAVAIGFGILVFDERPGSSLGVVAGEVVGLLAVVLGVRQLSVQPEDR
jgi:hypothetical protein